MTVVDDRTLAFPNYNGNGMYMAMGNILENSMVGLLFINWEKGHWLRLHGESRRPISLRRPRLRMQCR